MLDIRDNEYLISMERLAREDSFDLSEILESARLSVTYKGEMIAMPFNSSTIMLYYNKSAFEEVGISKPPRTLDELALAATKLKQTDAKGKVVRYGFANVPTTYELIVWLGHQRGVSYLTDEENDNWYHDKSPVIKWDDGQFPYQVETAICNRFPGKPDQ